jgi:hypothetical protein
MDVLHVYRNTQERIGVDRVMTIICSDSSPAVPLTSSQSIGESAAPAAPTPSPPDIRNAAPTAISVVVQNAVPNVTPTSSSVGSDAGSDSTRVPTRTVPPDAHPQILPMIIRPNDRRRLFCIVCFDRGCGLCGDETLLTAPYQDTEEFDHSWRHRIRNPGPNYLCMGCLNRYCELCAGNILPRHNGGHNG